MFYKKSRNNIYKEKYKLLKKSYEAELRYLKGRRISNKILEADNLSKVIWQEANSIAGNKVKIFIKTY